MQYLLIANKKLQYNIDKNIIYRILIEKYYTFYNSFQKEEGGLNLAVFVQLTKPY